MVIDRFTRAQFEAILPVHKDTGENLWRPGVLIMGEYTYRILTANPDVEIEVRSSVGPDEVAYGAGKNSIRCYMLSTGRFPHAVAPKLEKFIKRTPGWDERLLEDLRFFYKMSKRLKRCPTCKRLMRIINYEDGYALVCSGRINHIDFKHYFKVLDL
jgi:hypothetical protein